MKPPLLTLALFLALMKCAFAQTPPLTPSGPPTDPATAMKSLNQIEPRTVIPRTVNSTLFPPWQAVTISTPGSYYLAGDIGCSSENIAMAITCSDVTLDLNGFTVKAVGTSSFGKTAIVINGGCKNITIRNGHIDGGATVSGNTISGDGFTGAISCNNPDPVGSIRIESVTVTNMSGDGITVAGATVSNCSFDVIKGNAIGSAGMAESCSVSECTGNGIVNTSVVRNCKLHTILHDDDMKGMLDCGVVSGCSVTGGWEGGGIAAKQVSNCFVECLAALGAGITADIVTDCSARVYLSGAITAKIAVRCLGYASPSGNMVTATIRRDCLGNDSPLSDTP